MSKGRTPEDIITLRGEITEKLSNALIEATPKGITTAEMKEINRGIVWKFVFATMMAHGDARLIRDIVDDAIRTAVQLRGTTRPVQ